MCLHANGENLNGQIGNLVDRGLPRKVQQTLDIVRVTGNNAVHPRRIDLEEKDDTALQLFRLVSIICEYLITQPALVNSMYNSLPKDALDAIEKRDV